MATVHSLCQHAIIFKFLSAHKASKAYFHVDASLLPSKPHAAFATSLPLASFCRDLVSFVLGLGLAMARSDDQTSVASQVLSMVSEDS
jgi:hypothetical protein